MAKYGFDRRIRLEGDRFLFTFDESTANACQDKLWQINRTSLTEYFKTETNYVLVQSVAETKQCHDQRITGKGGNFDESTHAGQRCQDDRQHNLSICKFGGVAYVRRKQGVELLPQAKTVQIDHDGTQSRVFCQSLGCGV